MPKSFVIPPSVALTLLCTCLHGAAQEAASTLPAITVQAEGEAPAYAGGQVGVESSVGILGAKHFMDTPFASTSYTEESLRNQQAHDVAAVLRLDPAVHVPSSRNLYETFWVRGFVTTPDDMRFNGLPGMAPSNRSSTAMAERVEILKGPSAFLSGMPPGGSTGASIHLVPKRAGPTPLTRLTSSFESDGLWGVHVDAGRRFGANQQWGLRVNGAYRDGDTAVQRQKHENGLSALALDWRGQHARFSVDMYNQDEHMQGVDYVGIFAIAPTVTRLPSARKGDYALAPEWSFVKQNSHAAVLRGEWDIASDTTAWAAWGSKSSYYSAFIDWASLQDDAGQIGALAVRQVMSVSDKAADMGIRGKLQTGTLGHDWAVSFTRHEWKNGVRRAQYPVSAHFSDGDGLQFGATPDLADYDPSRHNLPRYSENTLRSVALADTLSWAQDTWQLTLGARHQQVQSHNLAFGQSYDESRLTPALALLHKASETLSLYGNYIEGLSQGDTAPAGSANAGATLKPYRAKQYELGAKMDWGHGAFTASLFQMTKPGAQTSPDTLVFAEYGSQRHRGVELQWFGALQHGLRLLGGLSYTQAQWHTTVQAEHQGKQVTGVPRLLAKMGAEYDVAHWPGLTLSGQMSHTGTRSATDDNRLRLPAYTTLDIGARYTLSNTLTVRADVRNLGNKAYWHGAHLGGDGSGLSGGLGAPRTLLLSASIDF